MVSILVLWFDRRHLQEDEREHGKHDCLDEANEDFKEKEWEREKIRHEVEHNNEKYFARKDVAEETESERDNFSYFRDKLENTNRRPDAVRLMEWTDEELLAVLHDTHRGDTGELDRKDNHERKCESEVQIR